jgi:hypothetical protein
MKRRKHRFTIVFSASVLSVLLLSQMGMGTASASTPTYSNDFETDTAGWFNNGGTITQQPSGYVNPGGYASGIASAGGSSFHARLDRGGCGTDTDGGGGPTVYCTGPFTRWGGYNKTWTGGWETQVDIYLDAAYAQANADSYSGNLLCLTTVSTDPSCKGTRFDYSSAVNNANGAFIRDFGFNVATGPDPHGNLTCSGFFVTAGMNIFRSGADPYSQGNTKCIPASGWYTFKHTFYANAGFLNVLMEIIPVGSATPAASWTVVSPDPISSGDPAKDVGCNRYGWFADQEIYGLPIDNASMTGCGKVSPTITTQLSGSGGNQGDTFHDSATLTDATTDAGGTVNYRYYSSVSACTDDTTGTAGTDVSIETVTGGVVPNSDDETFNTAGTFYWAAFYRGDARNNPAKSDCASEPLEIAKPGTLIVKKVVKNDNGGTLTADKFSFSVNGGSAIPFEADGQNDLTENAGKYTVTEVGPVAGYTTTYDNCTDVEVPAGGSATCTITNDDIQPKLIVIKKVVGGPAKSSDFTMTVTGSSPSPSSFPGADSPGTTVALNAGTYEVKETVLSGYTASFSADCKGSITVGATKTCTVTNTLSGDTGPHHIYMTATTCQNFRDTPAQFELAQIQYTAKANSVSQVNPGVFFYYATVKAPSSGDWTINTGQTNDGSPKWRDVAANRDQIILYTTGCVRVQAVVTTFANGTVTITVKPGNYTPGATYIYSVKYDPNSLLGQSVGSKTTVTYTFWTINQGVLDFTSFDSIKFVPKK